MRSQGREEIGEAVLIAALSTVAVETIHWVFEEAKWKLFAYRKKRQKQEKQARKEARGMPHYKNGREAKIGDSVVYRQWNGLPATGVIVTISPASKTCDANIVPTAGAQSVTLSDCLHVDDALPLAEKGA